MAIRASGVRHFPRANGGNFGTLNGWFSLAYWRFWPRRLRA
jgi:hypothetical protein